MKNEHSQVNLILIIFIFMSLSSCENAIYKKWDKKTLKDNVWHQGQYIIFEPEMKDTNRDYSITIGIRHHYGLQLNVMSLRVVYIAPSGNTETRIYNIAMTDDKGEPIASCLGSLCDLETETETAFRFKETGKYKVIIQQITVFEKLPGIMEVGLIIR